jgi:hypothetical protein
MCIERYQVRWFMGRISHTDTGWLSQASQVSGSERAAKQVFELANSISYARPAGPNVTHPEQNVPVHNQRRVYSQTHLDTSIRGVLNANKFCANRSQLALKHVVLNFYN